MLLRERGVPRAPFILVGRNFRLLCLMCSQSGEGATLLSNFTCHLPPNHFKAQALPKISSLFSPCLFPSSLPSFFRAFSCPPSCSRRRRSAPGNRGHLNDGARRRKKKTALEFYFQMSLQQHTSATRRASARRAGSAD